MVTFPLILLRHPCSCPWTWHGISTPRTLGRKRMGILPASVMVNNNQPKLTLAKSNLKKFLFLMSGVQMVIKHRHLLSFPLSLPINDNNKRFLQA